jgi:hypothetical protein
MTGARRSHLLQATKVNLLVHARRFNSHSAGFSVVIGEWERSHNNDSEEIYREGSPHGKEDPLRGLLHAEREFSRVCHVLRSKQELNAA